MDDSQRGSTYTARSIRIPVLKALLTSQILYVFVDVPNLMCDEARRISRLSNGNELTYKGIVKDMMNPIAVRFFVQSVSPRASKATYCATASMIRGKTYVFICSQTIKANPRELLASCDNPQPPKVAVDEQDQIRGLAAYV